VVTRRPARSGLRQWRYLVWQAAVAGECSGHGNTVPQDTNSAEQSRAKRRGGEGAWRLTKIHSKPLGEWQASTTANTTAMGHISYLRWLMLLLAHRPLTSHAVQPRNAIAMLQMPDLVRCGPRRMQECKKWPAPSPPHDGPARPGARKAGQEGMKCGWQLGPRERHHRLRQDDAFFSPSRTRVCHFCYSVLSQRHTARLQNLSASGAGKDSRQCRCVNVNVNVNVSVSVKMWRTVAQAAGNGPEGDSVPERLGQLPGPSQKNTTTVDRHRPSPSVSSCWCSQNSNPLASTTSTLVSTPLDHCWMTSSVWS
jgi:hypothetical protein